MKGWRFYEEFYGNVIAINLETADSALALTGKYESFAPIYFVRNSPVCYTAISPHYLYDNCERVSEKRAREIHPALFERLDAE